MSLALHFLTGKQKGSEFPLPDDRECLLGRTREDEIVMDSPGPQLHQAVLSTMGGKVFIKDLHSGVETLVNGKRITQTELREGDRIRVGPVSMMVIALTRFSPAVQNVSGGTQFLVKAKGPGKTGAVAGSALSGSLAETSLTEVLQFATQSHKDGVVRLNLPSGAAQIHVRDGRIVHASWEGQGTVGAVRILFRLLRQKTGTFEFGPPEEGVVPKEIDQPADSLLLEGIQEADEIRELLVKLPPLNACVEARGARGDLHLRDLSINELDVLETVLERPTIEAVMDRHPSSDLAAVRHLIRLIEGKLVAPIQEE